jgi:hypothetical protein
VAAAEGDLWLREAVHGDGIGPRYATQKRWTARVGQLLGLVGDEARAAGVREALDLAGLDHEEARRGFAVAATLAERGTVIVSILERVVVNEALWGRLLLAGFLSGTWAQPFLWDATISRRVFPGRGTAHALPARTPL